MPVQLTIDERFVLLRHRAQLGQAGLGKLLGVSPRTVRRIERAEGTVGEKRMAAIRARFEILERRQAGK